MCIFTDGIIAYISRENPHLQAVGKQTTLALQPTDDMAIGSFIISGPLGGMDQKIKYCYHWNVKCNLNKTKVMVLKKGEENLKNRKCQYMNCQRLWQ